MHTPTPERRSDRSTPSAGGSLGVLALTVAVLTVASFPLLVASFLAGALTVLTGLAVQWCRRRVSTPVTAVRDRVPGRPSGDDRRSRADASGGSPTCCP